MSKRKYEVNYDSFEKKQRQEPIYTHSQVKQILHRQRQEIISQYTEKIKELEKQLENKNTRFRDYSCSYIS